MLTRLRSWWKNTSKTLDAVIILMLVVLLAVIVVSILGYTYNLNWSGLHGKTFWDWLQLLIIPAVLAVGGYLFNYTTSRNEQAIASDNQSEAAMKEYFDNMSELLLHEKLRESSENDEVRMIARVLTLTVLRRCDGKRKANVLQFLYESGLIDKEKTIVDLNGADLSGADLNRTYFEEINLSGVDLQKANLHAAKLVSSDLSGAKLNMADISHTRLMRTNLHAAQMIKADLSVANLRSE